MEPMVLVWLSRILSGRGPFVIVLSDDENELHGRKASSMRAGGASEHHVSKDRYVFTL